MRKFADELELSGPMICGNGTQTFLDPENELCSSPMDQLAHLTIIDYANETKVHLNLYTGNNLYFLFDSPWGDLYKKRVETVRPELLPSGFEGTFLKAMVVDTPDRIQRHRNALMERLQDTPTRVTESEAEYLEFMDKAATKGSALERLAERLGIAREETAAVGDYLNDMEMLEWAGLSAAMGNGHPEAKRAANVTVSTNEEHGVAEFIDAYVLKQRQ
jgi:Cof subfamily protein (haloacid dehalogenase superfamily)